MESELLHIQANISMLCKNLIELYQNKFNLNYNHKNFNSFFKAIKNIFPDIKLFIELSKNIIKNPNILSELQQNLIKDFLELKLDNHHEKPNAAILQQSLSNNLIKIYKIVEKNLNFTINNLSNFNIITKIKLNFYINNFFATYIAIDPKNITQSLKHSTYFYFQFNSHINILKSLEQFLKDLLDHQGYFPTYLEYLKEFTIGKNLATTTGKIIIKNKLMELICYSPVTPTIFKVPILLIPSCINKYYILDLSKNNSLIKWLVKQGFIVYVISWCNPNDNMKLNYLNFHNYIFNGIIKAIDIITLKHQHSKVHVAGYCLGGTLLSCVASYLEQIKDHRIISITNFMTLLDFNNLGKLGIFTTKPLVNLAEDLMRHKGYLDGRLLYNLFNWLRPQDLIWPYIFNQFFFKQKLPMVDFLYWNADPTNLPEKMYGFYLRNFCIANKLATPNNQLILKKIPINLKKISVPIFSVAGSKDHITNWEAVYKSSSLYGGKIKFILANSGHIKGLINSPIENKYGFKTNNKFKLPADPNVWLATAKNHHGSWWLEWINWLKKINNVKTKSTFIKNLLSSDKLANAPGSYIHQRIVTHEDNLN